MSGPIMQVFQSMQQRQGLRQEASILNQEARDVNIQTAAAESAQRRAGAQFLATQRAAIGESGIGHGGSSAELEKQTAIDLELDALNIRYQGAMKSQSLRTQAKLAKRAGTTSMLLGLGTAAAMGRERRIQQQTLKASYDPLAVK